MCWSQTVYLCQRGQLWWWWDIFGGRHDWCITANTCTSSLVSFWHRPWLAEERKVMCVFRCVCVCLIGIWMMSSLYSRWLQKSHPFLQSMSPITCFTAQLSLHSHQSNHDLLSDSPLHFSLFWGQNIWKGNYLNRNMQPGDGLSALLDIQNFTLETDLEVKNIFLLCQDILMWIATFYQIGMRDVCCTNIPQWLSMKLWYRKAFLVTTAWFQGAFIQSERPIKECRFVAY